MDEDGDGDGAGDDDDIQMMVVTHSIRQHCRKAPMAGTKVCRKVP